MFSRVRISDPGDGSYIAGDVVSKASVMDENRELVAQGKEPATFDQLLLGITKVSVNSDSFLSGASFQDTTRVLISAAISGRVDHLGHRLCSPSPAADPANRAHNRCRDHKRVSMWASRRLYAGWAGYSYIPAVDRKSVV